MLWREQRRKLEDAPVLNFAQLPRTRNFRPWTSKSESPQFLLLQSYSRFSLLIPWWDSKRVGLILLGQVRKGTRRGSRPRESHRRELKEELAKRSDPSHPVHNMMLPATDLPLNRKQHLVDKWWEIGVASAELSTQSIFWPLWHDTSLSRQGNSL